PGPGLLFDRPFGFAAATGQCQQHGRQDEEVEWLEACVGGWNHRGAEGDTVGRGSASMNTPDAVTAAATSRSARSPAAVPMPRAQAAITTRAGAAPLAAAGTVAMPRSQLRRCWVPVLCSKR